MTIEGARLRIRNSYIRYTSNQRKKKINNNDFTIISNNCWGGTVYESYGLRKNSPTVGMYFAPVEYLKFISNLDYYINGASMQFVNPEKSRHVDLYRLDSTFGEYPIARLDDVEIALLHYKTQQDAREKWTRRCDRINWNKLIIKMNDQNGCTYDDMITFLNADLKCGYRLFFTSHKEWAKDYDSVVYIPQINKNHVFASLEPFGNSHLCNINEIINSL